MSRFSIPCPVCGRVIEPHEIPFAARTFNCPGCQSLFEFEKEFDSTAWAISFPLSLFTAYLFHLQGLVLFLAAAVLVPVLAFLLIFLYGFYRPPRARLIRDA